MELLKSEKECVTVKLSRRDMIRIRSVATAVGIQYAKLDPVVLDLERDEVDQLVDDLNKIKFA